MKKITSLLLIMVLCFSIIPVANAQSYETVYAPSTVVSSYVYQGDDRNASPYFIGDIRCNVGFTGPKSVNVALWNDGLGIVRNMLVTVTGYDRYDDTVGSIIRPCGDMFPGTMISEPFYFPITPFEITKVKVEVAYTYRDFFYSGSNYYYRPTSKTISIDQAA